MQISVLEARNNSGTLLWAEGCDPDGYSYHQVIIPKSEFTEDELSEIGDKDGYSILRHLSKSQLESDNINLGEIEANHYSGMEFTNFKINKISMEYK